MNWTTGELILLAALDRETDEKLSFILSCSGSLAVYRHEIIVYDVDDNGPYVTEWDDNLIINNETVAVTRLMN